MVSSLPQRVRSGRRCSFCEAFRSPGRLPCGWPLHSDDLATFRPSREALDLDSAFSSDIAGDSGELPGRPRYGKSGELLFLLRADYRPLSDSVVDCVATALN